MTLSGKTFEIIYYILTENLKIPESRIVKGGFEEAKLLQTNELLNISLSSSDNQKCISVLSDLCSVYSESYLYMHESDISYWQWITYNGVLGTPIYDKDVVPGSFSQEVLDEIYNEYTIAYNNGGTASYSVGKDKASQEKYGDGKVFASPKNKPESLSSVNFKILFASQTGAISVGEKKLLRYKEIRKQCRFTTDISLNYLQLGEVLDLRFSPFTREPVRIIGIKEDQTKRTVSFTAELVNYPKVIKLDITHTIRLNYFLQFLLTHLVY